MMRSTRSRLAAVSLTLAVAACGAALAAGAGPVSARSSGSGGGVWIQTMDSCKQALGGAAYEVSGGGTPITVTTPAGPSSTVAPATQCPLEQGSCSGAANGCASFAAPGPGTYTIRETVTPPGNTTNPEGYAPCEGGSACRSEVATLTVGSGGGVSATVTAVYPDGTSVTWPSSGSYAGSASDPIVFHDFGLAAPGSPHNAECDGDGDADDHLTGTPSGHCAYPESEEASACQPFPWSCQLGGGGAPVSSGPAAGGTPGQSHPSPGSSRGSGGGGGSGGSGSGSRGSGSGSGSGAGSRHNGSARSFRSS
jgi:hypothetical protein